MPSLPTLFTFDWDAPVPDDVRERLFDKIVWAVRRWRLELPMTLFLETTAPLSHLAGQCMIVGSPLLAALLPGGLADVQHLSKLLEDSNNVRHLAERINGEGADAARQ
ncbi:MAG: hypothetical protein JO250_21150 [Armatimonadetes bacterium]|nr:hypothetical protein [Armatimonadota bacterium]